LTSGTGRTNTSSKTGSIGKEYPKTG
jgi:hypothetical protein